MCPCGGGRTHERQFHKKLLRCKVVEDPLVDTNKRLCAIARTTTKRADDFRLPLSPNQTADNGVAQESPEVIAMLAKLGDALEGNLEPSDWGGSSPPRRHVQHQQRPGGHTASDARKNSGESGGWDGRQHHNRGARGTGAGPGNERCVLEDFTQCSKSHLWKLMMSFYDRKGVESWSQVWVYCSSMCVVSVLDTGLILGDGRVADWCVDLSVRGCVHTTHVHHFFQQQYPSETLLFAWSRSYVLEQEYNDTTSMKPT